MSADNGPSVVDPKLLNNPDYLVFSQFEESLKQPGIKESHDWVGVVGGIVVAIDSDRSVVDATINNAFPGQPSFVGQIGSERVARMNPFKIIIRGLSK